MMELSCESIRYLEGKRPKSSQFVELHVLYVPDDQWNVKLNKVPAEAIESFVSAGFIRVYPDTTLNTLRSELGVFLGTEIRVDKFSFLKCVGRSLAVVKHEQERDLKAKTFAPPYALQPELYLLPVVENSSVCSQSLTLDTRSSSPEPPLACYPHKRSSVPTGTKGPVKFPIIPQGSQQSPPTPSADEDEEEADEESAEDDSCSSTEGERENDREPPSSLDPDWIEESQKRRSKNQVIKPDSQCKAQIQELAGKEEMTSWKQATSTHSRSARESDQPESLEDRHSGFYLDRLRTSKDLQTKKLVKKKPKQMVPENQTMSPRLVQYSAQPPVLDQALKITHKATGSSVFQINRYEVIEEIKLVREERKRLEWARQELLRKGKDLLAQNRHHRNQARDSWKKKYFETKKATAPLEETLRNLRQELETFYNKVLHHLQARDGRGKTRGQGRSSTKNEFIIQIMTESHEIDNLRRQVEDAKMKLVTEIKLRKQAATELRALKAELAQKKSQSSHTGPLTSQPVGPTTRDRPYAQKTRN